MKSSHILGVSALLLTSLFVSSCQDDDIVKNIPLKIGDEISFGASASFKRGLLGRETRTEYGSIADNNQYVALNWVVGDKIEIVCPQDEGGTIGGTQQAVYIIADGNNDIDEGYVDDETDGNSYSSMLKKEDESGLKWGEGYRGTLNGTESEGLHDFYALYPSRTSFLSEDEGTITIDITPGTTEGNTDAVVTVTGTMPVAQNPAQALEKTGASTENGVTIPAHYIVKPDMRYAYMVAQTTVSRYRPEGETEAPIQLRFTPLVTALEFDITGGIVALDKYPDVKEVTILQLSLSSKSGKSICGNFTYYYTAGNGHDAGDCITSNTGTEGYNRVTMDLTTNGIGGAVLAEDEYCDVTFFLLPTAELTAGDLQLTIIYEVNGNVQYKTATIGVDLEAKKKYYFKDLVLPPIRQEITGSAWFGAIDDPVYMQQISMAVAGSAFSNLSDLNGTDISGENPIYYAKQQTKDYATLWDMGIRGFEFINQSRPNENASETYDMGEQYFVCGESVLDGTNGSEASPTFATAFDYLVNFIIDNETYPDYTDECLMLICRYHAVNDGYSPQRYVKNLLSFLNSRIGYAYGSGTLTKDHFVQYTAGLTVGEIKGKIAIIIRPGDDEYMQWVNSDVTSSIVLTDNDGNDWSGNVTLVQNWGSAYDRWDLRYGTNYGRESTWNTGINGGKDEIEDYLYAIVSSNSECAESNFLSGMPTPSTYTSQHVATPSYITPFVQEWQRVVPKELDNNIICTQNSNSGYYLWVRWPESTTERTNAIDATFAASINEKGKTSNNVYINQLSGYYITPRRDNSLEPFKQWFDLSESQSLTRYTPAFGTATEEGESCYIQFSRSDYYISTYSTDGYLYAQQDIQTESTYGQQWQLIGDANDFILKDNRGYYVSGLVGDYVKLSTDESDAASLKLVSRETYSSYLNAWEIQLLDNVSDSGYSIFNQFGGVQGTLVGVWSSDEGCAVYFTPVDGSGEGTTDEIEVPVSTITITPSAQGNGGNFAELAIDMNTHIYNKIVNKEYGEGPYGIVVMDYIGSTADELATCGGSEYSTESEREYAAAASTALTRLIYMNNFNFALQRAETTGEGDDDNTDTQGASVTFSSTSADAGEPIH